MQQQHTIIISVEIKTLSLNLLKEELDCTIRKLSGSGGGEQQKEDTDVLHLPVNCGSVYCYNLLDS
jgi:hypothetical protein